MHNNESAENYLETILMLSKKRPVVRSVDIATELDFNETVFAVPQMDNRIAFLSVFVSVMVNLTVQSICKHAKISDAKRFKEKSECL